MQRGETSSNQYLAKVFRLAVIQGTSVNQGRVNRGWGCICVRQVACRSSNFRLELTLTLVDENQWR